MKIKRLFPSTNLDTVRDGRGGIFTFIPDDPIVEFNFNYIKSGKIRGNHYHPEFDEYFLITEGEGVLVTRESDESKECVAIPAYASMGGYAGGPAPAPVPASIPAPAPVPRGPKIADNKARPDEKIAAKEANVADILDGWDD